MKVIERYSPAMKIMRGDGAWAIVSPARRVLAAVYGAYLRARGDPVRDGTAPETAANGRRPRVVSVGNIEVGGGGKTPCTIAIAEAIMRSGGTPVVLMRGYRSLASKRRAVPFVVPGGHPLEDAGESIHYHRARDAAMHDTARMIGDEAMLYLRRRIPVVIDGDRVRGARAAVRLFSPSHLLLDDAFHNRSLRKDVDVLLLDSTMPFGSGALLPYGTLRERPPAVRRADIVVFTRAEAAEVPPEAADLTREKIRLFARHAPEHLVSIDRAPIPVSYLEGRRVVLFSGIARPESFEKIVRETGANSQTAFRFIDHHRYRSADITEMLRGTPAGSLFVTTEKDWVKAAHLFPADVEVLALRIRMEVAGFERLMNAVMG